MIQCSYINERVSQISLNQSRSIDRSIGSGRISRTIAIYPSNHTNATDHRLYARTPPMPAISLYLARELLLTHSLDRSIGRLDVCVRVSLMREGNE